MTPKALYNLIEPLPAHQPLSLALELTLERRGQKTLPLMYADQKQHWLGRLADYRTGSGYGRANGRRTAEFVYNRLQCPPALLWLAEALGIALAILIAARRAALAAPANLAAQSAALRRELPWSVIEAALAGLPALALSIRPHWAHAVIYMGKNIENRDWSTRHRGPLLIHAAQNLTDTELEKLHRRARSRGLPLPKRGQIHTGGLIGIVEVVDVVEHSSSPWFKGPIGWVLRRPRPIPFISWTGQQRLFRVTDLPVNLGRGWR